MAKLLKKNKLVNDKNYCYNGCYIIMSNISKSSELVLFIDFIVSETDKTFQETIKLNTEYEIFDFSFALSNLDTKRLGKYIKTKLSNESFKTITVANDSSSFLDIYEDVTEQQMIDKESWMLFSYLFRLNEKVLMCRGSKLVKDASINYDDIFSINTAYNKDCSEIKMIKRLFKEKKLFPNYKSADIDSTSYLCHNGVDILITVLTHIFEYNNSILVKKCKHCGKWFIPLKSDALYCNRKSPQFPKKTCKNAAIHLNKLNSVNSATLAQKEWKKIYDSYYNIWNNNPTEKNERLLSELKANNEVYRSKLSKGKISESEYIAWVNSQRKTNKNRVDQHLKWRKNIWPFTK